MVERIEFFVPGEPVPKARARARVVNMRGRKAFAQMYTPKGTRSWEKDVATYALQARQKAGWQVEDSVFFATIVVYRKHRLKGGDVDNYAKAALDACNGVLWSDDNRAASTLVMIVPGEPGIRMFIERVPNKIHEKWWNTIVKEQNHSVRPLFPET